MKQHLKNFIDFSINENVEAKEYKVKDKHKAEDRLGELGIEWNDFIDHPDGTGFGTDGNLMAHYDEGNGMLYVHVDPSDIEIPSDEQIDKNRDFEEILKRYNSEMGIDKDEDEDDWYKEDEDSNDEEPSDDDISNVSFDDF